MHTVTRYKFIADGYGDWGIPCTASEIESAMREAWEQDFLDNGWGISFKADHDEVRMYLEYIGDDGHDDDNIYLFRGDGSKIEIMRGNYYEVIAEVYTKED